MGGPAKSNSAGPQGLKRVNVTEQEGSVESPLFRKTEENNTQAVIFKYQTTKYHKPEHNCC
jgi:hypothetical protein